MPDDRAATLICFALRTESRFFRRGRPSCRVLHTGIGPGNAERSLRKVLADYRPRLIVSSGFAGALDPSLSLHEPVYQTSGVHPLFPSLAELEIRQGAFLGHDRVVVTAEQKRRLRQSSSCDAVDMESAAIRRVTEENGIPCLIFRAISDTSREDLAFDPNDALTDRMTVSGVKLFGMLVRRPSRLRAMLRLRRTAAETARRLAEHLDRLLEWQRRGTRE